MGSFHWDEHFITGLDEIDKQQLAAVYRQLEIIALTDALTGLPNRRHAILRLEQAWEESLKENTPLSCIMIDANGFKQINDSFGHDAGDEVLRQLTRSLQYAIRNDDLICKAWRG